MLNKVFIPLVILNLFLLRHISLLWNLSEYSTISCSYRLFLHHLSPCSILMRHSNSSLPTIYWVHSLIMCLTVSVYPIHLLHHSCSVSYSWCLVLSVTADPSYPVLSLNMYVISLVLSLLSLRYSAYFCFFLSLFNSQNSYIVLNS